MASPSLPALKTNPKFIFFTDFDGTITQLDSNDFMFEHIGAGPEVRKKAFEDVMQGRRTFREMFREQMDQVTMPFDKCIELLLANIKLDEGFKEFYAWTRDNNVPIVVVSGGMEPVIRALLAHLLGEEEAKSLQIVSSFVGPRPGKDINEEGGWEIVYRDASSHGHDKSVTIRPYANLPKEQRPTLFYAGDGLSDLSAAKETDLLFAKAGQDLVAYCNREKIPFVEFNDFSKILATVKSIVDGKTTIDTVQQ